MAEDPVPNPPPFAGRETGWLEPRITRAAEQCARAGAEAAIFRHSRLPTPAEARAAVRGSALDCQPDWDEHLLQLEQRVCDFVAVVLRDEVALDDDPELVIERLLQRGAGVTEHVFVHALPMPALLTLKCIVDELTAARPGWDLTPPV